MEGAQSFKHFLLFNRPSQVCTGPSRKYQIAAEDEWDKLAAVLKGDGEAGIL